MKTKEKPESEKPKKQPDEVRSGKVEARVRKGNPGYYRNAIARASTWEEKRKAVYAFKDAIDRGVSFEEVMPTVIEAMKTDVPDVLVAGTFTFLSALEMGWNLTSAVPSLVHALYFLFGHHAAHTLIRFVNQDRSRGSLVLEAIKTEGRKEKNEDLDRVLTVCSSGIPAREWKWGKCGVHTFDACLTWYNDATGRNWSRQTYEDFRKKGPWAPSSVMKEHEVPERVWAEIHKLFGLTPKPRRTKEKIEAEVVATVSWLAQRQKAISPEVCPTCRSIPPSACADVGNGESLDKMMKPLQFVLDFHQGGESFFACSGCGALFRYDHEIDNEVGYSSDREFLVRVTPDEIGARLREAALRFEWTWPIPRTKGKGGNQGPKAGGNPV